MQGGREPHHCCCEHNIMEKINSFQTLPKMMKGNGFKYNVEAINYRFKKDLNLLIKIYGEAEQLANSKAKETKNEIEKINKKYIADINSPLTLEEQKIHEDFIDYGLHFNYITLHSLFITAYSFFENHLYEVSKKVEAYSLSKMKIEDMRKYKSKVDKPRKYLSCVCKLETAKSDNNQWQEIIKFQKVRNLIVHNGNKFDDTDAKKKELILFLKPYNVYMPREYSFHIKNSKFLNDFVKITTKYSDDIVTEIYSLK